jgi:hypothetical protein
MKKMPSYEDLAAGILLHKSIGINVHVLKQKFAELHKLPTKIVPVTKNQ